MHINKHIIIFVKYGNLLIKYIHHAVRWKCKFSYWTNHSNKTQKLTQAKIINNESHKLQSWKLYTIKKIYVLKYKLT